MYLSQSRSLSVPGPASVLGGLANVLQLFNDPVGHAEALFKNYGQVVALMRHKGWNFYSSEPGCPGNIFVYGPDFLRVTTMQHDLYAKHALIGQFAAYKDASERTAPLRYLVGGLFAVNGDEHRRQRHLLLPAFHNQRLADYYPTMVEIIQQEIAQLQPSSCYNMLDFLRLLTMKIVTRTLFDEDLQDFGPDFPLTLWSIDRLLASTLVYALPFDVPGLPFHRILTLIERFDQALHTVVARRRATSRARRDVLTILLQAREATDGTGISSIELFGHISAILAAGADSSSSALSWTLLLLAQHPAIMADLHDELTSVLHGNTPTIEQISRLPLLECVIKESMRLITPVPFTGCILSEETELGGHYMPRGTEIFPSVYHTHRMPELYAEPLRFNPRRWEDIRPTIFEYQPFSAGPRMCIGWSFAMLEMKLILATLLQRYRLQCSPHLRVDRSGLAVLNPKGGLPLMLYPQDRQFRQSVGCLTGQIREMVTLPM